MQWSNMVLEAEDLDMAAEGEDMAQYTDSLMVVCTPWTS